MEMDEQDNLPPMLTMVNVAAARYKEIQLMKKEIQSSTATKMAFQKLPQHMRRRAMSHNVKRLPRRLRQIHLNQMAKSGIPPKQKKPSRKYRRRPSNLMSEYARRKRRVKWLDTHIWHAKRFHMVEKWGYRLPDRPCDKAFRARYRATTRHCLFQDISYYRCVEINGKYDSIVQGFAKITDTSVGLTIAAKCYREGRREGAVTLFHYDTSNKSLGKPIGNVMFFWKPIMDNICTENGYRSLWIWLHPAFYAEALKEIHYCFKFMQVHMETDSANIVKTYTNIHGLELKEIESDLARFRLTGPLSLSVLKSSLNLAEIEKVSPEWMINSQEWLWAQADYWKSLNHTSQVHPNQIIALSVRDPRFRWPKKRTKATLEVIENEGQSSVDNPDIKITYSCIWDSEIRRQVKKDKISNARIAEMRSQMLVPGSEIGCNGEPLPILLIQRPGNKSREYGALGYASGWDVIVPSGWAQEFWLSFILWGARSGGLRESESVNFEMCQPDILPPDTRAGEEEESRISSECVDRFFKLPPNKRTNYIKFSSVSPLKWNWRILVENWCSRGDFFVLRNRKTLLEIQQFLSSKKPVIAPIVPENSLVPVVITLNSRGVCKEFSMICLPVVGDLKKEPIEAAREDPWEEQRKEMRKKHKELLKRLRRRRISAKQKGKVIPIDREMLKEYRTKMRKLWLPESNDIRNSCSRQVVGLVKRGAFSFQTGKGKAVGYIVGASLNEFVNTKTRDKVLLRSTNSRHYRLSTVKVVL